MVNADFAVHFLDHQLLSVADMIYYLYFIIVLY